MAAINTLDWSVFKIVFGYQQAIDWLCLTINTRQDIHVVIYHYVQKWHVTAINTLDCIVFTRFFGYRLAIGLVLAGYVPKSIHFKT